MGLAILHTEKGLFSMKKAFVFSDEKSEKFWNIDYSGADFAVNYGKTGTTGKYQIKEFGSDEECEKQALCMIAQKLKKGYKETCFDYEAHFYFDDAEIGLHPKTSHPNFVRHFTDEFYYDCSDEEAPFGSDEGSDTLAHIEEYLRKNNARIFDDFPQFIVETLWGMSYIPADNLDPKAVKALLEKDEMNTTQSDMVTYAVAFAAIKINGRISPALKQRGLNAMERYKITAKILGWGDGGEPEIGNRMISNLASFE